LIPKEEFAFAPNLSPPLAHGGRCDGFESRGKAKA
jgi:hypothetical protein